MSKGATFIKVAFLRCPVWTIRYPQESLAVRYRTFYDGVT